MMNPRSLSCIGAAWVAVFAGVAACQTKPQTPPSASGTIPQAAGSGSAAPAGAGVPSTGPTTARTASTPLKPEELDPLVAPIALYPDSLLAQVLMASTYPLEVVQADRWAKQNPKLKDSPAELNKLSWDPSVKSLIAFPQVLTMMSEKLDWSVKLGDAFLADQKGVMDAVQRLRGKAYASGNLQTTKEQKVTVEPAPAGAAGGGSSQVIVVDSANPSVVYVPTYNPTVVYGTWAYPAYPPYAYYPPSYSAGAAMVSFGVGMAVGAAWGYAWGGCNWHGGDVDIDVNRNVNFNQSIDRNKYNQVNPNRGGANGGRGSWQHDASHRKGVAYRDTATNERYRGSGASQKAAQNRESYRGRADAGRQDLSRQGAGASRDRASSNRGTGGATASQRDRTASGSGGRQSSSSRDTSGTRSSGFSNSGSGSAARSASSRGQSSRSSSGYSGSRSSGASRGGASRGGGGGGRGGGGGGRR